MRNAVAITVVAIALNSAWAAPPPVSMCPTTIVRVTTSPPVLDGVPSDPVWQEAPQLGPFVTIEGRPAKGQTCARLLCTADTLFIAVSCAAPRDAQLRVNQTHRDSAVWTDESVEVFLDPGVTFCKYLHLIVNTANVQRDESGDKTASPPFSEAWNGAWQSATSRDDAGWHVEFAVPFADLGLPPGVPALLGLNICRNDSLTGEATCWSPTLTGFHEPVRFGVASLPNAAALPVITLAIPQPATMALGAVSQPVTVRNESDASVFLSGLLIAGNEQGRTERSVGPVMFAPRAEMTVALTYTLKETGPNALVLAGSDISGNTVALAKLVGNVSEALGQDYGQRIAGGERLGLWWAESTRKIHREKPLPAATSDEVHFSAAGREFEAVQIVLRPQEATQVSLSVSDFRSQTATIPASNFRLYQVEYVPVTTPTDSFGWPGDWPDPLPPVEGPVACAAGVNQPFWLLAYVPPDTLPGTYRGTVTVSAGDTTIPVPVRLRVWGFSLTPETHTRSAYGVYPDFGFLGVTDRDQQRQVFDLYMQSCRDHRIAPYDPMAFYPMDIQVRAPMRRLSYGRFAVEMDRAGSSPWALYWDGKQVAWQQTSQTHFEKEGLGWQGTGLGWPYLGAIESIREVSASPTMRVFDVVGAHNGSGPCARSYKLTFRLFVPAGDQWFAMKLMQMEGTDPTEVEVREYFNIPRTAFKAEEVANGPDYAAWSGEGVGFGMICLGAPVGGLHVNVGTNGPTVSNSSGGFRIKQGQTHEGWGPLVVYFATDKTSSADLAARAEELRARINPDDLASYVPLQPATLAIQQRDDFSFSHDFTLFDQGARRYLDEFHFTGFNLPCMPSDIAGYPRFTPEYKRLHKLMFAPVIEHLRQRGWLHKAYSYWYDEPDEAAYPYVIEGMKLLGENCPGLTRLLTEQPEQPLHGFVDLWVPVLSAYNPERCHERQTAGDQVWWYVCCGPRAPYPNNFVDHPAIAHRIRFWMAEKYGVTGSLYWSTTYYGPLPDGSPRNPWKEAMTYTPDGQGTWGNGDGMLLYPACRERSTTPVITGPVESIRWEMLRDGIEDREYFWTLRQEVARLEALRPWATGDRARVIDAALDNARRALRLPDSLAQSLTKYTKDPQELLQAREAVAWAVEVCRGVE